MVDPVLDINGWDLKKFLKGVKKPNMTPYEWLQSPIIYRQFEGFQQSLWEIAKPFFNPISGMFHYLNLARNSLKEARQGDQVRLKKYFYVLRPILAARWIDEKLQAPPMEFRPLLSTLADRPDLLTEIDKLLDIKKDVNEDFLTDPVPVLEFFFNAEFERMFKTLSNIKPQTDDLEKLNHFFVEMVKKYSIR